MKSVLKSTSVAALPDSAAIATDAPPDNDSINTLLV